MGLWIGVDPGGNTGIVAVTLQNGYGQKDRLRHHQTLIRPPTATYDAWAQRVLDEVVALRRRLYGEDGGLPVQGAYPARVAVETIVPTNPHLGRINGDGIALAAMIAGYLLGWGHARGGTVVPVRPGQYGKGPLATYPPELVGSRVKVGSGDQHRHERSAWDIARAGPAALRWHAAQVSA